MGVPDRSLIGGAARFRNRHPHVALVQGGTDPDGTGRGLRVRVQTGQDLPRDDPHREDIRERQKGCD